MSKKRGTTDEDAGFELAPPPDVLPEPEPVAEPVASEPATAAAEPAAEPPPALAPAPDLPFVPLDVFCRLSGHKFDQTKGFARWAKGQGLASLTMPEWREQWQKFQNRPVI